MGIAWLGTESFSFYLPIRFNSRILKIDSQFGAQGYCALYPSPLCDKKVIMTYSGMKAE